MRPIVAGPPRARAPTLPLLSLWGSNLDSRTRFKCPRMSIFELKLINASLSLCEIWLEIVREFLSYPSDGPTKKR